MGLLLALETNDRLALERLATQPLENFFGFVRWEANNINTADETLRTIAHTDIVKDVNCVLELDEQVHKRDNLGEVQVGHRSPNEKSVDVEMFPISIPKRSQRSALRGPPRLGYSDGGRKTGVLTVQGLPIIVANGAKVSRRDNEENHTFMLGSVLKIITIFQF
jgi:hypothetical protein